MASPEHSYTPVSHEEPSPRDRSGESSGHGSRNGSRPPKKSARIHWQPEGESMNTKKEREKFNIRDHSGSSPNRENKKPLPRGRQGSTHIRAGSASPTSHSPPSFTQEVNEALKKAPLRPSILRHSSTGSEDSANDADQNGNEISVPTRVAQRTAQSRAQRLSRDLGIKSAPASRHASPLPVQSPPSSPPPENQYKTSIDFENIPLERLQTKRTRYGIEDDSESEGSDENRPHKKKHNRFHKAARRIIRRHTKKDARRQFKFPAMASQTSLHTGQLTPEAERDPNDYVPRPKEYHEGILSSIMRLYNEQGPGSGSASSHPPENRGHRHTGSRDSLMGWISSPLASGRVTPEQKENSGQTTPKHQKWYYKEPSPSTTPSIANLVSSSRVLAQPTGGNLTKAEETSPPVYGRSAGMRPAPRTKAAASGSREAISTIYNKFTGSGQQDEIKIHMHIADVLKRQQYLLKLCKALMSYGAPTHRLEGQYSYALTDDTMLMTSRIYANVG